MGILRRTSDGWTHMLGAEHVIGRAVNSALRLDHEHVSNVHAVVRWVGNAWSVSDLNSHNGTFLNGVRLGQGQHPPLARQARVHFGDPSVEWELVDAGGPEVMAVPLDGGPAAVLGDGVLAMPGVASPRASVFLRDAQWVLEANETQITIQDGAIIEVDGQRFRFHCAQSVIATKTNRIADKIGGPSLRFLVSQDEEHVELSILRDGTWNSMGRRACYYLGLTLARARLKHQREGLLEDGWVDVDRLLKMRPDYGGAEHVNVDIYRIRIQLARQGAQNAAGIIERRPGQVRLGTAKIEVKTRRD